MRKKLLFPLIIIAFPAILLGFISKPFVDEKPKVVVVLKDLNTQYFEIMKAGAEEGFQDFNIDGLVIAPRYKSKKDVQEYLLETVLKEKPDVLVISPVESPVVMSKLQKFVETGIPVLLVDTDVSLENKISYIGTENYELGRKAGELLASELQPGDEVAIISGNFASPISGDRVRGAKSSLEEAGIKIATEKRDLPNEPSPVKNAMREILRNNPNIKGVFATTDIMALSVLEELEEQGYKMPVIGTDGIIEMVELVEEGKLSGTVAQNPYVMGYLSAQTAMQVAKGKNVDTIIDSGVDIIIKGNGDERLAFLEKY